MISLEVLLSTEVIPSLMNWNMKTKKFHLFVLTVKMNQIHVDDL